VAHEAVRIENAHTHGMERRANAIKSLALAEQASATATKTATEAHSNVAETMRDNISLMNELQQPQGSPQGQNSQNQAPEQPGPQQGPQQAPQPQQQAMPQGPPGGAAMPPPIHGAVQAPDGNHYVPDPRRPGKFMRVVIHG
jgi:hypothetical protein